MISKTSTAVKSERTIDDETRFHHMKNVLRNTLIDSTSVFHCAFDETTREGFSQSTDDFIHRAKEFNRSLSTDDIYQALRNVWIINSIQSYLGQAIVLTPSGFAYSLLYPYTDNVLDAPNIDSETKRILNTRIAYRLSGVQILPASDLEGDIFKLFDIIEKEFDRSYYPHVYESLLAIHHSQIRSLSQQSNDRKLFPQELLDISIEKGGTSVLADGYLISGDLSADDSGFLFGYGVLLQLIDDLQDIDCDLDHHQTTLFHVTAARESLDEITNRLLSFIHGVLLLAHRPKFHDENGLGELIERSCHVMVLEAIARNHAYYSASYVHAIEKYSPVRFEYFRQMKDRLGKFRKRLPGRQPAPPCGTRRVCPNFIET
jgi:hypothetical protein